MIDGELINRAGISYEAGMKRFMDDQELYETVLTAFADEDIFRAGSSRLRGKG